MFFKIAGSLTIFLLKPLAGQIWTAGHQFDICGLRIPGNFLSGFLLLTPFSFFQPVLPHFYSIIDPRNLYKSRNIPIINPQIHRTVLISLVCYEHLKNTRLVSHIMLCIIHSYISCFGNPWSHWNNMTNKLTSIDSSLDHVTYRTAVDNR